MIKKNDTKNIQNISKNNKGLNNFNNASKKEDDTGLIDKGKKAVKDTIEKVKETGKETIKGLTNIAIEKADPELLGWAVGKGYNHVFNWATKKVFGKDAAGELDASYAKMNDKNYTKDTISIDNYKDKRVQKYQGYLSILKKAICTMPII